LKPQQQISVEHSMVSTNSSSQQSKIVAKDELDDLLLATGWVLWFIMSYIIPSIHSYTKAMYVIILLFD